MVKVREEHPENDDGSVNLDRWLARLAVGDDVDLGQLKLACELAYRAEQKTPNPDYCWAEQGSSYRVGLEMAEIFFAQRKSNIQ